MNRSKDVISGKKAGAGKFELALFIAIIIFVISVPSLILAANETANPESFENKIEDSEIIEVWAGTSIDIMIERDKVKSLLIMDNGSVLSGEEIEFYLNDLFIDGKLTNENGYAELSLGSGTYGLRVNYTGNSEFYLNPSSKELEVEVKGIIKIKEPETNRSEIEENITEVQINASATSITVTLENGYCKEFKEKVLWSSGFTRDKKGSINYQTWYPEHDCSELNSSDCFIGDINLETRFIVRDYSEKIEPREGNIQVSELSSCDSPEKGLYKKQVVQEFLLGEDDRKSIYCNKRKDSECELEIDKVDIEPLDYSECYGIKSRADPHIIVDVFRVDYTLCTLGGEDEN